MKTKRVTGTTFEIFMLNLQRFLQAGYVLTSEYGLTPDGSYFAEVKEAGK